MTVSIEPRLLTFIQDVLDTPLKRELLAFFADNQGMDTAKGLSIWLGRTPSEVQDAAEALVRAGILQRQGMDENAVYAYRPASEVVPIIDAFLHLYRSAREQLLTELKQVKKQAEEAWEQLRALQWEQSRFRLVLSSMTDGVLVLLPDGAISYINEACARLFGQRAEAIVGKRLSELETPLASALLQGISEVNQISHPAITREWFLPDGTIIHTNLMPVFGERQEFFGVVGVLTEMTRLRERERQHREMLTVLAHDIKSPLTAIQGFALSGVKGMLGELPPAVARAFKLIAEQSERVHQMVRQMIHLMVEAQGVPPIRPVRFDLRESAQSLASVYEGQCSERGLNLSVEIDSQPIWVQADRDLIERAIANLMSNAVKYNRPNGSIRVRALVKDGEAVLEVEDTGIGIPPSELSLIFRQFYRASTASGEGSGVGLTFVRQVVEAHRGRVEVNSSVGQGSLFRIVLPLAPQPASP